MATMINTKSNLFKKALGINNTSSNESSDSEDVPRGEYLSNLPKAQVVIPKGLASFLIQRNDPKPIEIDQVDTLQEFDFCQSLDTVLCGKEVPPKEQIKWFVKLMKRTKQDSDKLKIIRILQKIKDKDLWNEFYAQKGAPVLFNWATTPFILNSEQNSYAMLCIIRLLPYQAEIFDQCKFHKFVTKKIKSGTQANQDFATIVYNELLEKIEPKSSDLKRSKDENPNPPKKLKTEEVDPKRVKVPEKKPIQASSGKSVFEMLSQPAQTVISTAPKVKLSDIAKSLKRKASDPPPVTVSSSKPAPRSSTDVSPLDTLLASSTLTFRQVTTPTEERKAPTISEKTGKPKKAVRFKPDNEITNVVLFGINDLPLSVATGKPEVQEEPMTSKTVDGEPQIEYVTPRSIRLPPFPQCKVYSREAEFQHQREMQVLSVHYLSPRDIPISPMEPEDYYEPPSIPTMIPLDKPGSQPIGLSNTVVPQISVLQSLTANPSYLSALLQQQPINNWNQVPVQNYNPPIPAVFQKSYGQPPIPSRGRAGIPKAFRNRK